MMNPKPQFVKVGSEMNRTHPEAKVETEACHGSPQKGRQFTPKLILSAGRCDPLQLRKMGVRASGVALATDCGRLRGVDVCGSNCK